MESREAIVIGGGQAGVAAAYELRRAGVDAVVLEAHARIGDSWRRRWDSLKLFTPARLAGLPGSDFPAPVMTFPTKDQMADYVETYAEDAGLEVRTSTRVVALRRLENDYFVDTTTGTLTTKHVVIATGYNSPKVPQFAKLLASDIKRLHAVDYRNPDQLTGDVLVVGAGTSGVEIAMDSVRAGHRTVLAGPGTGEMPPFVYVFGGRIFWFYATRVVSIRTPMGRRMRRWVLKHGAPLVRLKMADVVRAGIERRSRVTDVREGLPVFADGDTMRPGTIVWCTGFRRDYRWIEPEIPLDDGLPRQRDGAVEGQPGLYVVGLPFQTSFASGLIGGVGHDAALVATTIARRLSIQRSIAEPAPLASASL